jgi:predicted DNA-binding protein (MmcQ/YjbR family)
LLTWENVQVAPHRFGGVEYRLGSRELGHIHGDHMLDIPFPKKVRDEVVANGQVSPHHLLPETGWVSLYLRQPEDVNTAIELLQRSYQIAVAQRQSRKMIE